MNIYWTPKSENDLENIYSFVCNHFSNEKAKEVVINIINYTEEVLSNNPLAGKILESNPMFSFLVFEGNSIFYCEHPKNKNIYIIYVQPRKTNLDSDRINPKEIK